ncbi:pyridoxamine 5'-phosphate oxidase family protein [bacterium]|nr:pyridoxamine 5'-phosphate oxidase family protein [bacterium]
MSENTNKMKEEVWNLFQPFQEVYLATCDGKKPYVRPVTLIHHDQKLWVGTGTSDEKIKQIDLNSTIEFCLPLSQGESVGYIRGSCIANIVKNKATKDLLANIMPYFDNHWNGLDDPNYTLLRLDLKEIEYLPPNEYSAKKFKV